MKMTRKLSVLVLVLIGVFFATNGLFTHNNAFAYNKPWDQGHDGSQPKPPEEPELPCEEPCDKCKSTTSPVFMGDGNFVRKLVDFKVPGDMPIVMARTYNSQDNYRTGFFGYGWTMGLESKALEFDNDGAEPYVRILMPTGKRWTFTENQDGTYSSPKPNISLTKLPDGSFQLDILPSERWTYNFDGLLAKVEDGKGNWIEVEYTNGCLSKIKNNKDNDEDNHEVDFTAGPNGKIAQVQVDGVDRATYSYDAAGNLTGYADALGNQTTYQYDDSHNLTAILDPLGNTILTVTYDLDDRVHTYQDKDGLYSYTYLSATQTKVIDAGGNEWIYTFDSAGLITGITAPDSTSETRSYDANGNLIQTIDRNGNTTTYTYDANGNVLTRTDALGNVTTLTYDANGRLTSETDALGNTRIYTYDANGNRSSVTYPNGTTLTFACDGQGRVTTVTDPNGNTTTYTYDTDGNLTNVRNAAGETHPRTYDANGNLTSETNPAGKTTNYVYDANNRLTKVTDPSGNETEYAYADSGNLTQITDPNGGTYGFAFDAYNRLTTTTDPLGNQSTRTYNNLGRVASQTDANGNTTAFTYDANHLYSHQITQMQQTVSGSVVTTTQGYDANGNLTSTTDPMGNATTYGYNALNQKTSVTLPTGESVQYQYDSSGNLLSVVSPNGGQRTYTYNSAGQVMGVSDGSGTLIQYEYDALYRKVAETDGAGNQTTFTYDAVGRQAQFTTSDGKTTGIVYQDGRIKTFNTPDEKNITLAYFDNGKVKSYTDSLGNQYSATYDGNGNLLSIIDPNGNVTGFAYDALDRKTEEIHPDVSKKQFAYDAVGNLTTYTNPDSSTVTMTYDERKMLTRRSYSSGAPDDLFGYFDNGLLNSAVKGDWRVEYTYDGFGRLLSEDQDGKVVAYSWDVPNRIKTIIYPGGKQIKKYYDTQTRQTSIQDGAGNHLVDFSWSLSGVMSNMAYLNGVEGSTALDANRRMQEIAYSNGAVDFIKRQYSYNANNKIVLEKNIVDADTSKEFGYDANDRLVNYEVGTVVGDQVPNPLEYITYGLDPLSNWLQKDDNGVVESRTVNNLNEYTNVGGVAFTYSANGDLTRDGTYDYTYDELGRLLKVERVSDGSVVATYKYDALGRRVAKTTGQGTTYYYYDTLLNVIEERHGSDIATYVYGYGLYGAGSNQLVQMERGGNVYYYHQDFRGNVLALTDASGNVVESYQYDPYGNFEVISDGSTVDVSQVGNPYAFTGRRYDEESGLYYFRNRYYSPVLGRFTTRDPLGYESGLNLFEYASSNPVTTVDPMGLGAESCSPVSVGADLGSMGLGKYIEATRAAKKLTSVWQKIASKTGLGKGVNFGLTLGGSLNFCNKDCCTKNVTTNIQYYKGIISLEVSAYTQRMPLGNFGMVGVADTKADNNSFVGIVWSLGIKAGGSITIQPVFLKGCVLDYKLGEVCVYVGGWVKIEGGLDISVAGTGGKALLAGTLGPTGKLCYGMTGWLVEVCLGGDIKAEAGIKVFWVDVGSVIVTVAQGKICWSNQQSFYGGLELFGTQVI